MCLQWLIGDRESSCSPACSRSHGKPVCGSDGRNYDTNCDLEWAKCKDQAGQTKCRTERIQALEQAKRPQESIFIPECNDDGTFAQVQCHTLTGYCWCATTDGKPVSGSSVQNKTPVCSGTPPLCLVYFYCVCAWNREVMDNILEDIC
uniref:SPARC related modular calcium binding 1 n=1 Tax=Sinocyclocheilus grahami TaxID=75366 RepID=A0A672QIW9_SINGR